MLMPKATEERTKSPLSCQKLIAFTEWIVSIVLLRLFQYNCAV